MFRIALLVISLIPLGCAAPFLAAQPETQRWDEPAQGAEMVVSVGDPLLSGGKPSSIGRSSYPPGCRQADTRSLLANTS